MVTWHRKPSECWEWAVNHTSCRIAQWYRVAPDSLKRLYSQGQGRAACVLRSTADKSIDSNGIYVPLTVFWEKCPEVASVTGSLNMSEQIPRELILSNVRYISKRAVWECILLNLLVEWNQLVFQHVASGWCFLCSSHHHHPHNEDIWEGLCLTVN